MSNQTKPEGGADVHSSALLGIYGKDQIDMWRNRVERWGWPTTGHYMLAPDEDFAKSGDYALVHGETMQTFSLSATDTDTLEHEAALWRLIFPNAQVAVPKRRK